MSDVDIRTRIRNAKQILIDKHVLQFKKAAYRVGCSDTPTVCRALLLNLGSSQIIDHFMRTFIHIGNELPEKVIEDRQEKS